MIRTTLQDIVPLVAIGEAWVAGLDPSIPQPVDQLRGKAFWAQEKRGNPFYTVIRQDSLDLDTEVEAPICVVEWPSGKHALYLPEGPRPYQNRQYLSGVDDCYSVVREFYQRERGILLPSFKVNRAELLSGDFNLFDSHPAAGAWDRVITPQVGDAVLFKFGNALAHNHCGVMLEDGWMLHHFPDRLSTVEKLDGAWKANLSEYRRHRD